MDTNAPKGQPLSGLPKLEFVGPTVDDDLRRIIGRYGGDAVKAALARLTKPKRGRPKIQDWKELRPFVEEDARIWLGGGDPFTVRKNYAIAKAIADANPGHDHASTMQRIERKLSAKTGRKWFMLAAALDMSREGYPYLKHVFALEALADYDKEHSWTEVLSHVKTSIADFAELHGPPSDDLTMKQIEEGSRPLNALAHFTSPKRRGLFGSFGS